MQLFIGNKNYSSWSMRPWVLLRQFGLPFEEVQLRFDGFQPDSRFKQAITKVSGAGKVPVLVDGDLVVWDTLAIAEYVAEKFPEQAIWPREPRARARARSLCAEMHSGFSALRSCFGMNIDAALPEVGARMLAERADARADLDRIVTLWSDALAASGGPFLFGEFSNADAYFAPVCSRIRTYALPVPAALAAYVDRMHATAGMSAWVREALDEREFLPFEEDYRQAP